MFPFVLLLQRMVRLKMPDDIDHILFHRFSFRCWF